MYKCPTCGMTSEQAGKCPTCNVDMVEVAAEVQQPAAPAEVAPQPEAPQA